MRTSCEQSAGQVGRTKPELPLLGDRTANGGGPRTTLPREATQHSGPVLKAKGPSPARRIAESSCRPHTAPGGEGPKRRVGSEGLASRDMERPEFAKAARESSYVLHSGFHQRAHTGQDIALGKPSSSQTARSKASFSRAAPRFLGLQKISAVVRGGGQ